MHTMRVHKVVPWWRRPEVPIVKDDARDGNRDVPAIDFSRRAVFIPHAATEPSDILKIRNRDSEMLGYGKWCLCCGGG